MICTWFESYNKIFGEQKHVVSTCISGTLRNYDGDGERQKNNWFNEQNNNSAHASRFFVHFFAVPAQLRHEMTKF